MNKSNLRDIILGFNKFPAVLIKGLPLFLIWALLSNSSLCFAKSINFNISVDKNKVSLGKSLSLYLSFEGTTSISAPELPDIDGFQSRYAGPSTRMSIVNGQTSSSITHIYALIPLKVGVFNIGPFKVEYNGEIYNSNALKVEAAEGLAQDQLSAEPREIESKDISDRIFLIMQANKNKVYLNELVPVRIKLYVNGLSIRDIQYPEFGHEGFSAVEFEKPRQYEEVLSGVTYDVIEFNTSVFGVSPGEFKLGPAALKCNILVRKETKRRVSSGFDDFFDSGVFDNFFGGYEVYPLDLKSTDIPVSVSSLPAEDRPGSFEGAVGDFDLEASVSPPEVKVGDPVTLKLSISGEGNFSTVNNPKLKSTDGFKVYEPQVWQEKGRKTFEQVIMPMKEEITEIPAVTFSFFNMATGQYHTITKGPFAIKVSKPEKEEQPSIIENPSQSAAITKEEALGRDIVYIKNSAGRLTVIGGYLYKNLLFLWLQLIPLVCFIFVFAFHKRKTRLKADLKYARKLRAPKKAKEGIRKAKGYLNSKSALQFYDAVSHSLKEYLGDRFHLSSKGITISVVDDALIGKTIDGEILEKLRDIFSDCDMARYASSKFGAGDMENTLKKLEEVIDYFQRTKI